MVYKNRKRKWNKLGNNPVPNPGGSSNKEELKEFKKNGKIIPSQP